MTTKQQKKQRLDPVAMLVAVVLIVLGLVTAFLGYANREALGVWWTLIIMLGGLSTTGFAITAIKTGKVEWILLDLILPN